MSDGNEIDRGSRSSGPEMANRRKSRDFENPLLN